MNKSDLKLIVSILGITIIFLAIFSMIQKQEAKTAVIYYQNEVVQIIDLTQNEQREYIVEGANGPVVIEVNKGKIRVKQEESPLHICSKQGYISKNAEMIVCLPNKIIIQIEAKDIIDTVVR